MQPKNMKHIHFDTEKDFSLLPFLFNDELLLDCAPRWCMSLKKAGSMRFRWNEVNDNRKKLEQIVGREKSIVPLELIHSKIVYDVKKASDTFGKQGDGIITQNKNLVPSVTVADCMPIFLFDVRTKVFGVVHSGWKGTGIIEDAIFLAKKNYGATTETLCVALGPHIHSCCYLVTKERAQFFEKNFTSACIKKYEMQGSPLENWNTTGEELFTLSLKDANIFVLEKCGVPNSNIIVSDDCTCCDSHFGSFRRETLENTSCTNCVTTKDALIENQKFTVQAAFCLYP